VLQRPVPLAQGGVDPGQHEMSLPGFEVVLTAVVDPFEGDGVLEAGARPVQLAEQQQGTGFVPPAPGGIGGGDTVHAVTGDANPGDLGQGVAGEPSPVSRIVRRLRLDQQGPGQQGARHERDRVIGTVPGRPGPCLLPGEPGGLGQVGSGASLAVGDRQVRPGQPGEVAVLSGRFAATIKRGPQLTDDVSGRFAGVDALGADPHAQLGQLRIGRGEPLREELQQAGPVRRAIRDPHRSAIELHRRTGQPHHRRVAHRNQALTRAGHDRERGQPRGGPVGPADVAGQQRHRVPAGALPGRRWPALQHTQRFHRTAEPRRGFGLVAGPLVLRAERVRHHCAHRSAPAAEPAAAEPAAAEPAATVTSASATSASSELSPSRAASICLA
jgi:hypothetical protein